VEVEAGMNIENLTMLLNATYKLFVIWWPLVLFAIVGIFVVDRNAEKRLEK